MLLSLTRMSSPDTQDALSTWPERIRSGQVLNAERIRAERIRSAPDTSAHVVWDGSEARASIALVRKACRKRRLEPLLELMPLLLWSARRARNVVWNRFWSSCPCCFGPQGVLETSFGTAFGARA